MSPSKLMAGLPRLLARLGWALTGCRKNSMIRLSEGGVSASPLPTAQSSRQFTERTSWAAGFKAGPSEVRGRLFAILLMVAACAAPVSLGLPPQADLCSASKLIQNGRYSEAERELESLASSSRDAQVLFALCQVKLSLKKTQEALALARQLGELGANDAGALYSLGRLLVENGFGDRATPLLERAHGLSPVSSTVTAELVAADLSAKRQTQADQLMGGLLREAGYGDLVRAGSRLGELGYYTAAQRLFSRALELRPDAYDALFNLAFAYYHERDPGRTLETLDRIAPTEAAAHPDYHYLHGKVELDLKRPDLAARDWLKALALQPDNESLCSEAGLLFFRTDNFWKALEVYEGCARRLPDSVPVATGLGLTYFRLGKYERAISAFRRVLAVDPNADAAREALGFLDYVSGDLSEARTLLERRMKAPDTDSYTFYLHALVLERLEPRGDHAAALRSLDEALRRNPSFAPSFFQRGKVQAERGDFGAALADLRKATELDPSYAQPYYWIAQVSYKLGRKEDAQKARLRFAELDREREEKQQKRQMENRLLQALGK